MLGENGFPGPDQQIIVFVDQKGVTDKFQFAHVHNIIVSLNQEINLGTFLRMISQYPCGLNGCDSFNAKGPFYLPGMQETEVFKSGAAPIQDLGFLLPVIP